MYMTGRSGLALALHLLGVHVEDLEMQCGGGKTTLNSNH